MNYINYSKGKNEPKGPKGWLPSCFAVLNIINLPEESLWQVFKGKSCIGQVASSPSFAVVRIVLSETVAVFGNSSWKFPELPASMGKVTHSVIEISSTALVSLTSMPVPWMSSITQKLLLTTDTFKGL